jgi:phage protein D/phage baseplate assembly protein gpV
MSQSYFAPRFDVKISGITLGADITQRVISATYEGSLDDADMFKIVVSNPNNQFTDSSLFTPGQDVELYMGYGNDLTPMMLGEITSIAPNFPENGPPTIAISGYDKSYRMRHNQSIPRQFKFMTDSLMVAEIAAENLLIPIVDPSPWYHSTMTQTGTDFGFIKTLASNNLFDAYVYWDSLYFQLPIQTQAYVLEWGQSLRSFSPRLSTATMSGLQIIRGYNEELATAIIGVATGELLDLNDIINRLGPATLEMLASLGRRWIHSQSITSPIDGLALAKSLLQQLLDGLYEGNGSCIGIPALRAGSYIQVAGVGNRFGGIYRLRKVTHTIDDSGYLTEFDITQQAESSLLALIRKKTDIELTPPRNRNEKYYGLYVGKVLQTPMIGTDPDPASVLGARVKVSFPWLSDLNESGWARVVTPQAGLGSGVYFMPNIGDIVMVAFQEGDLSMPVVLGSVWDGPSHPPVYPPLASNLVQKIKTRFGHTITLDDTPATASVTVAHINGSQVSMTADGKVSVTAIKDLNLTAVGNINLTATGNINMQANNVTVAVTGSMNVT